MDERGVLCSLPLTGVAAALTAALGVPAPLQADAPNPAILNLVGEEKVDRVVMYNPDAVALWLYEKYTRLFLPAMAQTQLTLPLRTVMPSVTPVCFATMYTGTEPSVHGIQGYYKPVVRTDSVFDALMRAGRRPCIVSTGEDSMSKIFLERQMDYFIVDTPEQANEKAMALLTAENYDLISIYNGNYDAAMHRFSPESGEALDALCRNVAAFAKLADCIRSLKDGRRTLLGFAPDHGCHAIDGGLGSHGLDMPEDMNIVHFYGLLQGS